MKMKIDLSKNLTQLENINWGEPEYSSRLVKRCHELRLKKLADFDVEDLRIMIGQNIGNDYLIPIAIEILKLNPFAEGDFYEGDLLQSVVNSESTFWIKYPEYVNEMVDIVNEAFEKLDGIDTTQEIRDSILEAIKKFKS